MIARKIRTGGKQSILKAAAVPTNRLLQYTGISTIVFLVLVPVKPTYSYPSDLEQLK